MIKQRTRHDCAICTIAMALGRTYEEVMTAALAAEAFDPAEGCRSEYRIIEAFGLKQMADFRILHRGSDDHGAILSAAFFRQFSWGRRAILAVPSLNTPGGFHSVYWTGASLADPCELKTYSYWQELRPDEIILFSETRQR